MGIRINAVCPSTTVSPLPSCPLRHILRHSQLGFATLLVPGVWAVWKIKRLRRDIGWAGGLQPLGPLLRTMVLKYRMFGEKHANKRVPEPRDPSTGAGVGAGGMAPSSSTSISARLKCVQGHSSRVMNIAHTRPCEGIIWSKQQCVACICANTCESVYERYDNHK